MKKVYFDHAATTPIDPQVIKAMEPYFSQKFGNASSLHSFGQEAKRALDKARDQVAGYFNCQPEEVVFTSGATESNNLALRGVVYALGRESEIITTQFEHPAVLAVCKYLEKQGNKVIYLQPNKEGLITVDQIEAAITAKTNLVSIMYANNEIGTIQPIAAIGEKLAKINRVRAIRNQERIYFHTDATQAVAYCDCQLDRLKVDLLSFSGHKIYGPKGVGALIIKQGTPIKGIQSGGHQENGLRAGTYNVPGIVGLGKAISLISRPSQKAKVSSRIKKLRDYLAQELEKIVPDIIVNGTMEQRLPNNLNVTFLLAEGESILLALDQKGIAVSTGSACASGTLEPSHVLLSIGVPKEQAHGSIRITLGRENTLAEVNYFLKVILPIVEKLRKMSPLK